METSLEELAGGLAILGGIFFMAFAPLVALRLGNRGSASLLTWALITALPTALMAFFLAIVAPGSFNAQMAGGLLLFFLGPPLLFLSLILYVSARANFGFRGPSSEVIALVLALALAALGAFRTIGTP